MMKVLIVHELFMPDFAGGGEKLVYEMAKGLLGKGVKVKVLTSGDPKVKKFEGIWTKRLPINRYLMNFAFFSILREAKGADIIQTSTYNACFPCWLVGKILRKPVVCLVMSYWGKRWSEMRKGFAGFFSRLFEGVQVGRSYDKLVFLSDFSKEFSLSSGLSGKNAIVINPGVEISDYKPLEKEEFVLFSGRFARQKGVYDVLEVAKRLPEVKFVMMGWGEEEEALREKATRNVVFLNYSIKEGLAFFEQYGKAGLFFLPSYGETFGFVLVEAMASGCAVVSTIPLGYEGEVVKVGDIEGMVEAIDGLMGDKAKRAELGGRNVVLARKFNWDNFTNSLLEVYDSVLKKH